MPGGRPSRYGRQRLFDSSLARRANAAATAMRVERLTGASTWVCLLLHHVTDERAFRADDPWIAGLGIDTPLDRFERTLDFVADHYDVVSIDEATTAPPRRRGERPRLVITFDDAYASVPRIAAPQLAARGLPWTYLVNPGPVDRRIALDNLLAFVGATQGLDVLAPVLGRRPSDLREVLLDLIPRLPPARKLTLLADVAATAGMDVPAAPAADALYATPGEIAGLARAGVDIGNHTRDHADCRFLDDAGADRQIVESAQRLREMSGAPVREFAYPYGAADPGNAAVQAKLVAAGHSRALLVGGRLNSHRVPSDGLYRVPASPSSDLGTLDTAVLPWLRAVLAGPRRLAARLGSAGC